MGRRNANRAHMRAFKYMNQLTFVMFILTLM